MMTLLILKLIGLAAISYLIAVGATPIQLLKNKLNLMEIKENNSKTKNFIIELINCSLCTGFWIGLLFTASFIYAGIVAIAAEYICMKLSNKKFF